MIGENQDQFERLVFHSNIAIRLLILIYTKTQTNMTEEQKQQLLKFQQGELNALLIYQRLAKITKHPKGKEVFSEIAADEGRHAGTLRSYTKKVLKPRAGKAILVGFLYKLLGHNFVIGLLEKGEMKSIKSYRPLKDDFPKIQQIMDDELRHAEMAKSLLT